MRKQRVACHAVALETFPRLCRSGIWPSFPGWAKLRTAADGCGKVTMPRIDGLSDAEFMKLQAGLWRQPSDLSDLHVGRRAASAPGVGGRRCCVG